MNTDAQLQTFSSREFAHELARVKRAAAQGPVLITDRGQPKYALLSIEKYWDLTSHQVAGRTLLKAMQDLTSTAGVDFEVPARNYGVKPADLD